MLGWCSGGRSPSRTSSDSSDPDETVLDLAAGYCEFINALHCRDKIAVDLNPAVAEMAAPEVRVVAGLGHRSPR